MATVVDAPPVAKDRRREMTLSKLISSSVLSLLKLQQVSPVYILRTQSLLDIPAPDPPALVCSLMKWRENWIAFMSFCLSLACGFWYIFLRLISSTLLFKTYLLPHWAEISQLLSVLWHQIGQWNANRTRCVTSLWTPPASDLLFSPFLSWKPEIFQTWHCSQQAVKTDSEHSHA